MSHRAGGHERVFLMFRTYHVVIAPGAITTEGNSENTGGGRHEFRVGFLASMTLLGTISFVVLYCLYYCCKL